MIVIKRLFSLADILDYDINSKEALLLNDINKWYSDLFDTLKLSNDNTYITKKEPTIDVFQFDSDYLYFDYDVYWIPLSKNFNLTFLDQEFLTFYFIRKYTKFNFKSIAFF